MIRRFGERIVPQQRYKLRPGIYAVLMRGNSVLLTHQARPVPEVQLPGGGIDQGEHLIPALHREVMEETGWCITAPRRLGAFRNYSYMPEYSLWAEKLCHVYLARPTRRLGPPTEHGHLSFWAPATEASELLDSPGARFFMEHVARGLLP